MGRATVRDDRGVRRRVAAAESGAGGRGWGLWAVSLVVLVGSIALTVALWPNVLFLVLPIVLAGPVWRGRGRRVRGEVGRAVAAGMCPVCGDDLRRVEPEADGCRVCRVCGSAWRVPGSNGAG